jgi:hypothetical protein
MYILFFLVLVAISIVAYVLWSRRPTKPSLAVIQEAATNNPKSTTLALILERLKKNEPTNP